MARRETRPDRAGAAPGVRVLDGLATGRRPSWRSSSGPTSPSDRGGPRRPLRAARARARVPGRPHERDHPRLPQAVRPRPRPDLPVRRNPRGLRPVRARGRRLLREPARVRRPPELPADHARPAADGGRVLDRAGSGPRRGSRSGSASAFPPTSTSRSRSAGSEAARYIAEYNVWMHHVRRRPTARGSSPPGCGCSRTGICATRSSPTTTTRRPASRSSGRSRRSWSGSSRRPIPQAAVDNPGVDWNPVHERGPARRREGLRPAAARRDAAPRAGRSPTRATRACSSVFRACRKADPYSPRRRRSWRAVSTRTARSPSRASARCSRASSPRRSSRAWRSSISARLGRPLEPFDIWYSGFTLEGRRTRRRSSTRSSARRYPTADAYKKDIPNLLRHLGFTPEKADWLAANIVVDPGAGIRARARRARGAATRRTCGRASRRTG